jgi:hypothetical protein
VMPPTQTPLMLPPPDVIPTNTPALPPGMGGGIGDTGPAGTGMQVILTNTPNPAAAAALIPQASPTQPQRVGDCLVMNNTGNMLTIYQFADSTSDVIGVMAPGDSYRTWIHTGKDVAEPFYQIFLVGSEMRLGWVDAIATDLLAMNGNGPCNSLLLEPTPTDPAFPGNLPTPITDDSICRISPATGGTVRVYAQPNANSAVISAYNAGNLLIATARYNNRWLQVDVRGQIAWADEGQFALNGDCFALPVLDVLPETMPTPIPTPTTGATPTVSTP